MDIKSFNWFRFEAETISWRKKLLYIIIAYSFGLISRLILLYQATRIGGFWNSGLPISIWTPDAGRYGYYAKSILSGVQYPLQTDYLLGYLIAGVSKVFALPVDWVMLFLPIMIAPLVVIPLINIAESIKQATMGFLAALILVSDTFFYFRSFIGYMDTDGINLLLILTSIAFIMKSFGDKHRYLYALLSASTLLIFSLWYHSSSIIILAIVGATAIYLLAFRRRDVDSLQLLYLISIALLPLGASYKIASLILLGMIFFLLNKKYQISSKSYLIALLLLFCIAIFTIDSNYYLHRATNYIEMSPYLHFEAGGVTYSYPNDLRNVGEVQGVNIWEAYAPLFVTVLYILIATFGYLLLLLAYPLLLTTLPLMLLGYSSSLAGIRFAFYASPVLALGAIYLLYLLRKTMLVWLQPSRYIHRSPFYITMLITLLMIYNIFQFNTSAILSLPFYNTEKSAIEKFAQNINSEDTIISWWDYGWPLWYYTGYDNTLTDNGYHGGPDTNLISKILVSQDQNFSYNATKLLGTNRVSAKDNNYTFVLPYLLQDHNYTTLLHLLKTKDISNKKSSSQVYILLHRDMLTYFINIAKHSQEDLRGHREDIEATYNITPLTRPFSHNYSLVEGYGYILDSSTGEVIDGDNVTTKANTLMITKNNKRSESFRFHNDSKNFYIVDRGSFIWLDESYYKSFFIQAMLFDVYDKNLFEKVAETGRIKIFRVKK